MLGHWIQHHVTRRRIEDRDGNLVSGDVRLVHALVEELLLTATVVIDSPVTFVAACPPSRALAAHGLFSIRWT
jgi:hypothetical protein